MEDDEDNKEVGRKEGQLTARTRRSSPMLRPHLPGSGLEEVQSQRVRRNKPASTIHNCKDVIWLV